MIEKPDFYRQAPNFTIDWSRYHAAVWRDLSFKLKPLATPDCPLLDSLLGIDAQKRSLIANTKSFVDSKGGFHVLLWGARGCGKSSLIRAVLPLFTDQGLRIIQIDTHSFYMLEELIDHLRELPWKFILLCDDLSLDNSASSLVKLKVLLDGSIEAVPNNVLFYASSNRRHLLPEPKHAGAAVGDFGELHFNDEVESTLALADRFGLWLSFYSGNQHEYLNVVKQSLDSTNIKYSEKLSIAALSFARSRGVYSGRTAKHFVQQLKQGYKKT